jgi:alcohol dehydrogenase (cytochrome c)
MMNGDYARCAIPSSPSSIATTSRTFGWLGALALGGMQDVGQNGPGEVNPLDDNGFMYTTDGWGMAQDRRPQSEQRRVRLISDPAFATRACPAHARHRVGRPRIANLPDGR